MMYLSVILCLTFSITIPLLELKMNTKLSVLTLALFALKFSLDARSLKEDLYRGYAQMGGLNKQWLGVFKTMPVGIIVAQPKKPGKISKADRLSK